MNFNSTKKNHLLHFLQYFFQCVFRFFIPNLNYHFQFLKLMLLFMVHFKTTLFHLLFLQNHLLILSNSPILIYAICFVLYHHFIIQLQFIKRHFINFILILHSHHQNLFYPIKEYLTQLFVNHQSIILLICFYHRFTYHFIFKLCCYLLYFLI